MTPVDKPFIASELKTLKRKRMREYSIRGKSAKYIQLKDEFDRKYKKAAECFMRKNIESLKISNPGKAYNIMKKMGARPGDLDDSSNFVLPEHDGLSAIEPNS